MIILKKKKTMGIACVVIVPAAMLFFAAGAVPAAGAVYRRLQLFAAVLSCIDRFYVDPVDNDSLVIGAVQGMVRILDPHSAFLSPEDLEMLEADTQGEFGGVGLEVGIKDNNIIVIAPMDNSPAARANIAPGDRLIAIDGNDTSDMSIDEAVRRMRGKVGTAVNATFLRMGEKTPFDVRLVREVIRVKSVEADMIQPGFPWIRVRVFQDGTTAEVKKIINGFQDKIGELKGILLDLRRNPGGVLDEAVRFSDLFLDAGVIVSTRGRGDEPLEVYKAHHLGTIRDIPVVVLIDETAASAAEIAAGALQDNGRALVVGQKSFGKGSVQSIMELQDGFGLKLTIARYFTPSGRSIQAEGVIPDIIVESRVAPEKDAGDEAFPAEADLPGHLKAAASGSKSDIDVTKIEDYQLRIALQVLTGVARREAVKNNR